MAGNVDRDHHVVGARVVEKAERRRVAVARNDLGRNFGKVAAEPGFARQEALEAPGSVEPGFQRG